jgi:hypothetical protein
MPFGHGIGDPERFYEVYNKFIKGEQVVNMHVKSGSGYTLSANPIDGKIEATIQNSNETEPARRTGLVLTAGISILGAIPFFFPNLMSDNAWALIYYFIAFLAPVITAVRIRGKVWSPASVSAVLREALDAAENVKKR